MEMNSTLNGFETVFDVLKPNVDGESNDIKDKTDNDIIESPTDEELEALKNKGKKSKQAEDDDNQIDMNDIDDDDDDDDDVKTTKKTTKQTRKVIETDDDDQRHEHVQTELGQAGVKQSQIQAEHRKCDHDALYDQAGGAGPDTGIGLTVVFLHNFFHVSGSTYFHGIDDLFHCGSSVSLFLEKAHWLPPLNGIFILPDSIRLRRGNSAAV